MVDISHERKIDESICRTKHRQTGMSVPEPLNCGVHLYRLRLYQFLLTSHLDMILGSNPRHLAAILINNHDRAPLDKRSIAFSFQDKSKGFAIPHVAIRVR